MTHPESLPAASPDELNQLLTLFGTGHYVELEERLRSRLAQQENVGIYWSLLGLALQMQNKDSLPALHRAVALLPDDAGLHNELGRALQQQGQFEAALPCHRRALAIRPDFAEAHYNMAHALSCLGRGEAAMAAYRRALAIRPDYVEALNNLGNTLRAADRLDEAVTSYTRALEINPDYAEAHNNLGAVQRELGQLTAAVASCRRALACNPQFAQAHNNLGVALQDLGQLDDSLASLRQAVALQPDYAEAHNNLGRTLQCLHRPAEAIASYRRALAIQPDLIDALNNLALQLTSRDEPLAALHAIQQSLNLRETPRAKKIFVACVRRLPPTLADPAIQATLLRALTEAWTAPGELVAVSVDFIRHDPLIEPCIARAVSAWPHRLAAGELFNGLAAGALAQNPLLLALLEAGPVFSIALERFLTLARHALLDMAGNMATDDPALPFYGALAGQCFINEYLFSQTPEETARAAALREALLSALQQGEPIPAPWLLAVAAYFPLHALPQADRLLAQAWPPEVERILDQQLREPLAERGLRAAMPRLTGVSNGTSLLVQQQYEENPFPRWTRMALTEESQNILVYLRRKFPLAAFNTADPLANPEVLIAGCGTGQHAIGSAQLIKGARLLAIDLSLASLVYAKRKSQALALESITYAQADLLELKASGREFDVIESCGVLHHLADPFAGWRALLSMLRPGGYMRLGFYSALARRDIVRIRDFIAMQGYGTTAAEIRRCRQDLIDLDASADFGNTLTSPDFFSLSNCRDLLFHVQEHRLTLTGIAAFLAENRLTLLGLDISDEVLQAYKQRFPNDPAALRLDQWQAFETEHPDTFVGMYQFWIQKAA